MEELATLFEEIITFEEEINRSTNGISTYPDRSRAKQGFYEYVEWRFQRMTLEDPVDWIQGLQLDLCA